MLLKSFYKIPPRHLPHFPRQNGIQRASEGDISVSSCSTISSMCAAWSALSRPRIRFFVGWKPLVPEIEMPKTGGRIHLRRAGPAQVVLPQGDPPTRPPTSRPAPRLVSLEVFRPTN